MTTYLHACGSDLERALELYRWNANVSGALWVALGHVEIVLRNAIHDALTTRHQRSKRAGYWFDDPRRELDPRALDDITTAKRRAGQVTVPAALPGKVVAELSFGFWRYLLARRYSSTLWPAIRHSFPHLPGRDRGRLERQVIRLHQLRNRIAHHEPLIREDLPARVADLGSILDAVDPALRPWALDDAGRLTTLLANRP
ncbi:Abi family protein [Pseudonocardia sp. H11422]|uniref:Abi family protein n=1 Tax=Pseudonocardia sp. H11422 TaxID=2835866 RepID=UPI001BDD8511|nr:Abi family protein [Pseudonocardia sp. H11422]